jgi:large subunit ribosomal protein L19e
MNLRNKKELAARALKVGKDRVAFVEARKDEIKEAITKQDMRDLHADDAIRIKEISGRKTKVKKKTRRSTGQIRKKINTRKKDYVIMTRKLRAYVAEMKKQGLLSREEVSEIRKRIRNKAFRSKAHLKDFIQNKERYLSSTSGSGSRAGSKKTKKKQSKKTRSKKK